jgi:glucuronate isomerase
MKPFLGEDSLLQSAAARDLYHSYAEHEPILDYHCHISPKDIAENRRFSDLFEIWLEGDHYKWRAMRANGVEERLCTGDAPSFEKFIAWARTVPATLRNPLYHWTHLELKRYFGIDRLLNETAAKRIWEEANAQLATDDLRVHGIFKKFNVKAVCTTDDPTDDLRYHKQIAASGLPTRVFPAFRPDKALNVHLPEQFNGWAAKLADASNTDIRNFKAFLDAIRQRHEFFHQMGARLSDHGLERCYADLCPEATAAAIFDRARTGKAANAEEQSQFASYMMLYFGHLDAAAGWTKQLHLGARRNNNFRMFKALGPDTGFDSIGDWPQVDALGTYLGRLAADGALPRTIVYNVNPTDNYAFATMVGNFAEDSVPGKMQFGGGWWYLDQKEGIEWQLNTLSNVGLLSRFVGMTTDSRSFMSYPRHEYFRRVLCNLLGSDLENGELPDDVELIGGMIRNICFNNAREFFALDMTPAVGHEQILA